LCTALQIFHILGSNYKVAISLSSRRKYNVNISDTVLILRVHEEITLEVISYYMTHYLQQDLIIANQKFLRYHTSVDCYKFSFFPRTCAVPEWNDLPARIAQCKSLDTFNQYLQEYIIVCCTSAPGGLC